MRRFHGAISGCFPKFKAFYFGPVARGCALSGERANNHLSVAPRHLDRGRTTMIEEFTAAAVSAQRPEASNIFVVALAERQDGSGKHVEFQRALSFDEQDRRSRMDTYCLSIENGATYYGGVKSWEFEDGTLNVPPDTPAARLLGVSGLRIHLLVCEADIQRVEAGLKHVFGTEGATSC